MQTINRKYKDSVFRTLKNDVAFVMEDSFIVLAEHQSTICSNMPLRDLIYMSAMLQRMINTDELYRKKLLKIPRPTFIVFYDGKEDFPEYQRKYLAKSCTVYVQHECIEICDFVMHSFFTTDRQGV